MDLADPETAPTILPFTKFEIAGKSELLWARLLGLRRRAKDREPYELHPSTTRSITLSVDSLRPFKLYDFSRHTSRIEKNLGIESELLRGFSSGFCAARIRDFSHKTTAPMPGR
jgi:hypothetical protein